MPEVHVLLRWPDGTRTRVYSPSLVVEEHLTAGASYSVAALVELSRSALAEASDRVQARWGHPCSRAVASTAAVEAEAARQDQTGTVTVEGFER